MVLYCEIWHDDKLVKTVPTRADAISVIRGFIKMSNMMGMDVDVDGWYTVSVYNENIKHINPQDLI